MTEKLGSETRAKWNTKLGDVREYPSYKELNGRIHSLSDFASVANTVVNNSRNEGHSFVNNVSVQNSVNCAGSHSLANCEKFLSLLVEQRSILAREKRICFNCLRSGHFTPKCSRKSRYVHCRRTHHSLLHPEEGRTTKTVVNQAPGIDNSET
jgi:hypothetical protein